MVAAGRGSVNTAEQLLNLGANLNIRASNEWTALDWARSMKQNDVVELIEAYMWVVMTGVVSLSAWYLDVHFVFATSHFIFQDQKKILYMYLRVKAECYLTLSMMSV